MKKIFLLPLALSLTVGFGSMRSDMQRVIDINDIVSSSITPRLLLDNKKIMSERVTNLIRRLSDDGYTTSEICTEISMTLFDLNENIADDPLYKKGFLKLKSIVMKQLDKMITDE